MRCLNLPRLFIGVWPDGDKAQGGRLGGRVMFEAMGVHGPVLSPTAALVLDVLLAGLAFALLMKPSRHNTGDMAMLATLVVVTSAIRVLMAPLPNVQPVTVVALLVGARLGAARGVAYAVLVAMLSNAVLGDGWWTLFQAAGWAAVAVAGSRLDLGTSASPRLNRMALVSVVAAFGFGLVTNLSLVEPTTGLMTFLTLMVQSLPFDAVHAVGNVAFVVWCGPLMMRFLDRIATSMEHVIEVVERHVIDG
mgnify:CR=1 FL=1